MNEPCPDCGCDRPDGGDICPRCAMNAAFGWDEGGEPASVQTLGNYELLEEIARGGMGVVYKARQRGLGRVVALKMLLPGLLTGAECRRRFQIEAEAAAQLQHPGIVAVHEIGECNGQHYFTMDYVAGDNLGRHVHRNGVSIDQAARYVRAIAEAIHHAHQRGVLHRDLKPANVLIDEAGQPRVTDFGLARLLRRTADLTAAGQVMGTPAFMAPEQADPERGEVTVATDVHGLGAILYSLLTGKPPFQGDGLEQTILQVLAGNPMPLRLRNPAVPRDLETICMKCLEREPARRYATADEVAADLDRWLKHEPIRARPISSLAKLGLWARRNPALAALSITLVLSLAAGLVLQQRSLRQTRLARSEAESLIGFMTTNLVRKLRPVGRLALLESINTNVQAYYDRRQGSLNSPEFLAGKAHFLRNQADVLRDLGQLREARTNGLKALRILKRLHESEPLDPRWLSGLAATSGSLRNAFADGEGGNRDLSAAWEHGRTAVEFCERWFHSGAGGTAAAEALAEARLELASVLEKRSELAAAREQIERALEILTTPATTGTSLPRESLSATARYYQGLIHLRRGETTEAMDRFAEYRSRMTELRGLGVDATGDTPWEVDLMVAHSRLGQTFYESYLITEARRDFENFHALAGELLNRDSANSNYQLARKQSEQWLQSVRHQSALLSIMSNRWEWMVERPDAGHEAAHREFGKALDDLVFRSGRPPGKARLDFLNTWLDKALNRSNRTATPAAWQWTVATLRARVARAHFELDQFTPAAGQLREALPLRMALADAAPTDDEARTNVVATFFWLGRIAMKGDDLPTARLTAHRFLDWAKSPSAQCGPAHVRGPLATLCLETAAALTGQIPSQKEAAYKLLDRCREEVLEGADPDEETAASRVKIDQALALLRSDQPIQHGIAPP